MSDLQTELVGLLALDCMRMARGSICNADKAPAGSLSHGFSVTPLTASKFGWVSAAIPM